MDQYNFLEISTFIGIFLVLFLALFLITVKTKHKLGNQLFAFFLIGNAIDACRYLIHHIPENFINLEAFVARIGRSFDGNKTQRWKTVSYTIDGKDISYGLGWGMFTGGSDGNIVFYDRLITGLTSILLHNMSKNQSVIILSNVGNSIFPISNAVLDLINNKNYKIPVQNFSRIYGSLIENGSKEKASELIQEYLKNPNSYEASERDFNRLGYQFLRLQKCDQALKVFNAATLIFPKSWNFFDSYGEALHQCVKKAEAIKMYQKSVELNPENENGKQMLLIKPW